ncbi:hypothetical protein GU927_016465 [Rhodobacteraceae bacterium HSP-20]|uniref:Uncharacterized protein n=1 Tax=Paragemmobacter amnigenus TaxID=2852097 RepID=A0ABS6J7F7_9RHOB|nr:hypothetical protein [Rhodobacter amnigenus]MBU9699442.1 hypothetical protein [Rhodobacter amnigenus]MBV4390669.1 hypothetical protein [Rhodobacter amnigenus]
MALLLGGRVGAALLLRGRFLGHLRCSLWFRLWFGDPSVFYLGAKPGRGKKVP